MKRTLILVLLLALGCGDSAGGGNANSIVNLGNNATTNNTTNNSATNGATNNAGTNNNVVVNPSLGGTWYFADPSRNIQQMTLFFDHEVSQTTFEGRSLTSVDGSGFEPVQNCLPDCEYAGALTGTLDGRNVTIRIPKITIERTNLRGAQNMTGQVDETWRTLTLVNESADDQEPMILHRVAQPEPLTDGAVWNLTDPGVGGTVVPNGTLSAALKDHFVTFATEAGQYAADGITMRHHGVILSDGNVSGGFRLTVNAEIDAIPRIAKVDDSSFLLLSTKCFQPADAPAVVLTTDSTDLDIDYSGFDPGGPCLDVAARIALDGTVAWAVPYTSTYPNPIQDVVYRKASDDHVLLSPTGFRFLDNNGVTAEIPFAEGQGRPVAVVRDNGSFVVVRRMPGTGAVALTYDPTGDPIGSASLDLPSVGGIYTGTASPDGGLLFVATSEGLMKVVKLSSNLEVEWTFGADLQVDTTIRAFDDKVILMGRGGQHPVKVGPTEDLYDLTYLRMGALVLDNNGNLQGTYSLPGWGGRAWISEDKLFVIGRVLDEADITDNVALGQFLTRINPGLADRVRTYLAVYPIP